ncbi:MAG: hypothetical protein KGL02_10470, partial [Acidobacteriota bacterium]|nr:hypothetical protein [Acidobacteriota bacterium]
SAFWRAFRYLTEKHSFAALWTNLFRCSVEIRGSPGKFGSVIKNTTKTEQELLLASQRGLLSKEFRFLRPDGAVFFTGPNYDFVLLKEFPDARLEPVKRWTERQFSRVRSAELPEKSFRIYHPSYLNRDRHRWGWLEDLATLLAE